MKFLGIDYGEKRVGIAVSDESAEFAFPKAIVDRTLALAEVQRICKEEAIGGVVVGYSIAANGVPNEIATAAAAFKEKLAAATNLPVFFEREDFSSVEAHRYQIKAGKRDDSAAAIILQRFLDKKKKVQ